MVWSSSSVPDCEDHMLAWAHELIDVDVFLDVSVREIMIAVLNCCRL